MFILLWLYRMFILLWFTKSCRMATFYKFNIRILVFSKMKALQTKWFLGIRVSILQQLRMFQFIHWIINLVNNQSCVTQHLHCVLCNSHRWQIHKTWMGEGHLGLRETQRWGTPRDGGHPGMGDTQGWGTPRDGGHPGMGDTQGWGTPRDGGHPGMGDTQGWGTPRDGGHPGMGTPRDGDTQFCRAVLFHIGIWMFARFVRPLLYTLNMGNLVPAYTMCHVFPCWQKRKEKKRWPKKGHVTAPILKPTDDDQKPETFLGA